jgi:hypothetical protein
VPVGVGEAADGARMSRTATCSADERISRTLALHPPAPGRLPQLTSGHTWASQRLRAGPEVVRSAEGRRAGHRRLPKLTPTARAATAPRHVVAFA